MHVVCMWFDGKWKPQLFIMCSCLCRWRLMKLEKCARTRGWRRRSTRSCASSSSGRGRRRSASRRVGWRCAEVGKQEEDADLGFRIINLVQLYSLILWFYLNFFVCHINLVVAFFEWSMVKLVLYFQLFQELNSELS